jgi:uncharacterized protein YbjT (DUF2867 family)
MKTLVIGGTGTVGTEVVSGLLKKGVQVRVMTHSSKALTQLPRGVEGCKADLDDPASLSAAFEGVDRLFLLVPVGPNETNEGLCAVEAAMNAGVRKIVYLSVCMPEGSNVIPHFRSKRPVEDAIKASGIPFTILRPNNFFQNDLKLKDAIMQNGVYPMPFGSKGLNRVDVRDIADCAVNALINPAPDNQVYDINGPDTLRGEDVASIYSKNLGWKVSYGGDDLDAWAKQAAGVIPSSLLADYRIMYQYFQDHGMIAEKEELARMEKLLGHSPRSFNDFCREICQTWKSEIKRAA